MTLLPEEYDKIAARANLEALMELGFNINAWYYLSGPMTGYPEYNFPVFKEVTVTLRKSGLQIVSPHEIDEPDKSEFATEQEFWAECIRLDMLEMENCSGIIMLPGWPQSRGAREEIKFAFERNWPVWFYSNTNPDSLPLMVDMNFFPDA